MESAKVISPYKIAIDGIDASGKTIFADDLANYLKSKTSRQIIRASIDGFHNPEEIRLRKGKLSPVGYYEDSFDYESLKKLLLQPLIRSKNRSILTSIYDYRSKTKTNENYIIAEDNPILLFDGIFLLRKELFHYWDLCIFLEVSFKTALKRALERDIDYFGDEHVLKMRYEQRYFPGQQLYLHEAHPNQIADIVVDNNDYQNPEILRTHVR
ncbi:MAG: hypothetical protein JW794_00355 [Candidatus Cloacimonetes bacterium]|nr:hypothetical protein [Candidatus Cloacimonadota bacterium]